MYALNIETEGGRQDGESINKKLKKNQKIGFFSKECKVCEESGVTKLW